MKEIIPNLMLMFLGVVCVASAFFLNIDGTFGWLLNVLGIVLISAGALYKSNNPVRVLLEIFFGLF